MLATTFKLLCFEQYSSFYFLWSFIARYSTFYDIGGVLIIHTAALTEFILFHEANLRHSAEYLAAQRWSPGPTWLNSRWRSAGGTWCEHRRGNRGSARHESHSSATRIRLPRSDPGQHRRAERRAAVREWIHYKRQGSAVFNKADITDACVRKEIRLTITMFILYLI